ncbi:MULTISPECIES: hypothetical protein [Nostoc]|uniref:Uncharacterized protein n=2 Tax=Nostoc TaxID=1177 RepID=A0ABR8I6B6_9NOSO|nr:MULTISPECIES: hypothetical protein [Nostoc]MBD2561242.1 hypothetical protein [Nostoc linckia FACHB-391]MBD2646005.1 hypothetical protein [Nostoc foliaceum FACHB-393]
MVDSIKFAPNLEKYSSEAIVAKSKVLPYRGQSLLNCLIGKVRLNMNETLATTLGELQAQIYWLHDAEKFSEPLSWLNCLFLGLNAIGKL